jgi:hypothetical protein
MKIKIQSSDRGNRPGKFADAELQLEDGPLAGLKLIDFAIWRRREPEISGTSLSARQYNADGERSSSALLWPINDREARSRIPRPDPKGIRRREDKSHVTRSRRFAYRRCECKLPSRPNVDSQASFRV